MASGPGRQIGAEVRTLSQTDMQGLKWATSELIGPFANTRQPQYILFLGIRGTSEANITVIVGRQDAVDWHVLSGPGRAGAAGIPTLACVWGAAQGRDLSWTLAEVVIGACLCSDLDQFTIIKTAVSRNFICRSTAVARAIFVFVTRKQQPSAQ